MTYVDFATALQPEAQVVNRASLGVEVDSDRQEPEHFL